MVLFLVIVDVIACKFIIGIYVHEKQGRYRIMPIKIVPKDLSGQCFRASPKRIPQKGFHCGGRVDECWRTICYANTTCIIIYRYITYIICDETTQTLRDS